VVTVRLLAAAAFGAMIAAIAGGFSEASFTAEGGDLLALTWGRVTLVDIYLAFALGWAWIAWRERSPARAAAWGVATLMTGSLALFGYLLGAAMRAPDPEALVLGPRRTAR
jgi:hypothetical protein